MPHPLEGALAGPEILHALARVLRLDDTERTYLWSLAMPSPEAAASGPARERTVRPGVLQLLERWADLPAFVVGPDRDVLAATALATRVNPAWTPGNNLIEFTFLDPRAESVYPAWNEIALQAVAGLRATAAARHGELDGFVAGMRGRSERFRDLWDAHEVYERTAGEKQLRVDGAGDAPPHVRGVRAHRPRGPCPVRVLPPARQRGRAGAPPPRLTGRALRPRSGSRSRAPCGAGRGRPRSPIWRRPGWPHSCPRCS